MSSIKPPKPLLVDNDMDMAQEWSEWIETYENYFIAAKISEESAEVQAANFKATMGRSALKVLNSLGLSETEKNNIEIIIRKLSEHFTPAKNKTYERCQFHRIQQQNHETFEDFYQKLRVQVQKCSYGANADEFVKDQIVLGIYKESTRQKMWIEDELTLDRAIKICRADERANRQIAELHAEPAQCVNAVKKINNSSAENNNNSYKTSNKEFNCKRCGTKHGSRKCPAFNKKCKKCGKLGHFAVMCRNTKKVNTIDNDSDSEDDLIVGSVTVASNGGDNEKWQAIVNVGQHQLKLKLDTGAECNVLSEKEAKRLNAIVENSTTKKIIAYNNEAIKVIGEAKIYCKTPKKSGIILFKIIKENLQPVLGRDMCEKLGLIVRVNQLTKGNDNKLSYYKNYEYEIDLIENPKFKIIPARRIAYPLREEVKRELDKMVLLGVIEPITEPTPAVSPMLVVQKGSNLRVCMDPTELNKNIKRRHYPLRTVEEIAAKVGDAKYFTKLDCQKGFWQIKVTEQSSKYLTFSSPWGRFRYLRLPFGICSAPEIFCEIMNRTLQGIKNCEIAMDDIFLFAKSKEELQKTTDEVLNRLAKAGFTLNKKKCEHNKTSLKFLGHIFTQNGYKADAEKVEAIKQLKTPTNVTELQRLLGMVNYLGKFISNLSELTEPLRKLLHKNSAWVWDAEQEQAVKNIKKALSTTPVLKYYDVNKNVKLSVDASSKAMGACLMQDDQPVAYATRAFTSGQQNYPQIEKEAMAIKFACHKFHEYIYGKKLLIETDHKPLETIFKKPLHNAPLRLKKILWDVIQYSPEVRYIKGTSIPIADALSRDTNTTETENEEDYRVNIILSITDEAKERFREATAKDSELQLLKAEWLASGSKKNTESNCEIRKF